MNTDMPYCNHICRVPDDGSFTIDTPAGMAPAGADRKTARQDLKRLTRELAELQDRLYALNCHALLVIFQGMDASGKDSTIRNVFRGVDPAGCHVKSFKQPQTQELAHDFLWRCNPHLPGRGHIGIFNRSYYEEVLITRVHPELLRAQNLPPVDTEQRWLQRFESIRQHELHLARNGTLVLKFFLHLSRAEQRRRFLKRLREPDKHWKFSSSDIAERRYWDDYMRAYEQAMNATSRPWAPWYAIPADDKNHLHSTVATILATTLRDLAPAYPEADAERKKALLQARQHLLRERE